MFGFLSVIGKTIGNGSMFSVLATGALSIMNESVDYVSTFSSFFLISCCGLFGYYLLHYIESCGYRRGVNEACDYFDEETDNVDVMNNVSKETMQRLINEYKEENPDVIVNGRPSIDGK